MSEERTSEEIKKDKQSGYYSNKPKLGTKGPSKIRQQFGKGMTAFLVVAASILFYFLLLRLTNLSNIFSQIFEILKPIIYGFAIAYLLNPIVKTVDRHLVPVLEKRMEKEKSARTISRIAGIFLALVVLVVIVTTLCNMLLPELYQSIRDLVVTLPRQLNELAQRINEIELEDSTTNNILKTVVNEGTQMFQTWLRGDLLPQVNQIMSGLTVGVISVISELFKLVIGIIVSIYILYSKENFLHQSKKGVYALLSAHNANLVLHFAQKSNEIFGGFIIGKIIDSVIIGVLSFICLSILNMPYVLLVSVIIGVTNVIPFFGPYIGAIPSAILILLDDPMKGIYFIIFIIILQQIDGNFIGPKILGNSTGLSAFWVIFAILLGGGMFGFAGMLLGVPTFAVIYYMIQMLVNSKLERKKLPVQAKYYDEYSYVNDKGEFIISDEQEEEDAQEKLREEKMKEQKGE